MLNRQQRRVFLGAFSAETNVFSPIATTAQSFTAYFHCPAGSLSMDTEDMWPAPLEAFRQVAQEAGWTVAQGLCAAGEPAGPIVRADYEQLRDELLDDLRAAMPVDAVALSLHGAMAATDYDDCEGDILARVREIVGPGAAVGAVLDPHAHLTDAMLDNATVLVCFKENPHTDVFESARRLMELLAACVRGECEPAPSVFDCRMIGSYFTAIEPMRSFVEDMCALESRKHILSVSLVHGHPLGDAPGMGTKVLIYTDGRPDVGSAEAERLGRRLFELRGRTAPCVPGIDETFARLKPGAAKPIVIADISDNPGDGAPGDSTFVIRAAIDRNLRGVAAGPLWDPQAVAAAFALGEGATGRIRVGGKASPFSGPPLDLQVTVVRLEKDPCQLADGWLWPMGATARLECGGIALVVTSERLPCISADVFTSVGIDPGQCDVVIVKCGRHFLDQLEFAASVVCVDAPACLSVGDASRYRHLPRPKWPFDENPFRASPADVRNKRRSTT